MELYLQITKEKKVFYHNCPVCGKDLIPQIKKQLGIVDTHKFLPTNQLSFYSGPPKEISTKCCHIKIVYEFENTLPRAERQAEDIDLKEITEARGLLSD